MRTTGSWVQLIGFGIVMSGTFASAQSPSSTMSREVISATGCVQVAGADDRGEGIGTGFLLKGVRVAPAVGLLDAPRTPPTGTPPSHEGTPAATAAEPGSAAPGASAGESGADLARRDTGLLLVADRGVDLAAHVGHRVLVTGRLSSFAAPGGVASTSSGRTLTVTSLSLIAPACTTGS